MVVCYYPRLQLRSWPCCRYQGEHHSPRLGLCCIADCWYHHCPSCELPFLYSYNFIATNHHCQSTLLYSRYGNGIATNNLSKMLAGLMLPERPVGNMYFAAWSHNVISNAVNLSNDLKMGEYRK